MGIRCALGVHQSGDLYGRILIMDFPVFFTVMFLLVFGFILGYMTGYARAVKKLYRLTKGGAL